MKHGILAGAISISVVMATVPTRGDPSSAPSSSPTTIAAPTGNQVCYDPIGNVLNVPRDDPNRSYGRQDFLNLQNHGWTVINLGRHPQDIPVNALPPNTIVLPESHIGAVIGGTIKDGTKAAPLTGIEAEVHDSGSIHQLIDRSRPGVGPAQPWKDQEIMLILPPGSTLPSEYNTAPPSTTTTSQRPPSTSSGESLIPFNPYANLPDGGGDGDVMSDALVAGGTGGAAQGGGNESSGEAADTVRDNVKTTVQETVRETVRDTVRSNVRDGVRTTVRDTCTDNCRDNTRSNTRDTVRSTTRENCKGAGNCR